MPILHSNKEKNLCFQKRRGQPTPPEGAPAVLPYLMVRCRIDIMDNQLHSAVEVCSQCSISYRTLIRWVEQGVFPRKYLCRRRGRIFITSEGYNELKILGRLRKHLSIRKLRRFIDHFRDHDDDPIEGDFAVLKGPKGERKVIWENDTGKVIDLIETAPLQLPLFNFYSLEEILGGENTSIHTFIVVECLNKIDSPKVNYQNKCK